MNKSVESGHAVPPQLRVPRISVASKKTLRLEGEEAASKKALPKKPAAKQGNAKTRQS
jgi:hypothetical protein